MNSTQSTGSIWRQPAQVWAVAFASVVAFMGIGLVDPILPAIAESLEASPTETELLFTSYLLVTGLAMLITSWISSRIRKPRSWRKCWRRKARRRRLPRSQALMPTVKS